jgi:hypothetical protein
MNVVKKFKSEKKRERGKQKDKKRVLMAHQ